MRRRIMLALALPVLAGGGYLAWRWGWTPARNGAGVVRISGNIETTEVQLSFRIPGWVSRREVDEGQTVQAEAVVARLDDAELQAEAAGRAADVQAAEAALAELKAGARVEEIAQARAATGRAQAALDDLLAGARPEEISSAEQAVVAAGAEAERAQLDYKRLTELKEKGAAGPREYDAARLAQEATAARLKQARDQLALIRQGPRKEQIEQARSALKEAQQRQALVEKGPRQESIDQAAARLAQIRQALAVAKTRLDYATLKSPIAGAVLSKNVERGEYVSAGTPIVTIGDIRNVYLRGYVEEGDLGKVKLGQSVKVTADTYPGKVYAGTVSFIASEAEFTPKNVQTKKERVKLVYRVKIDIPNPDMELKPGMPADAEIELGSHPD